jgi:hypothetical protein
MANATLEDDAFKNHLQKCNNLQMLEDLVEKADLSCECDICAPEVHAALKCSRKHFHYTIDLSSYKTLNSQDNLVDEPLNHCRTQRSMRSEIMHLVRSTISYFD